MTRAEDCTYGISVGSVTITGYQCPGEAVTIFSTINDLPVTSIEHGAFGNRFGLRSITIPDRVRRIGNLAPIGCTSPVR